MNSFISVARFPSMVWRWLRITMASISGARLLERVSRGYRRVRWYDGKTYLWIGRYRETGRGEGSSNLRFDQIEPVKKA